MPVIFSHSFSSGIFSLTDLSVSVPDSLESEFLDLSEPGSDSSSLFELLFGSGYSS